MPKKINHKISAKELTGGWIDGTVDGFRFQAKVFDEGSMYGIDEGRVSKLCVWNEAQQKTSRNIWRATIINYDRGWDIEPATAEHKEILRALLAYLSALPVSE